jgi:hypothetical protein
LGSGTRGVPAGNEPTETPALPAPAIRSNKTVALSAVACATHGNAGVENNNVAQKKKYRFTWDPVVL